MPNHSSTNDAVMRLAEVVASSPGCGRGQIMDKLGCNESVSTVHRWITLGIQDGLLVRTGNTSSAAYWPSDELTKKMLLRYLASDVRKRRRVGYNTEFLDGYEPNVTHYLTKEELRRLHARCAPGAAPLQAIGDNELGRFLCDLSYASSNLEGNGYNYADTLQLMQLEIEKQSGTERDKVMIQNHYAAAKYLVRCVKDLEPGMSVISPITLREIHSLLAHELIRDSNQIGALRTRHVEIYESSYIPLDNPDWIANQFARMTEKVAQINDPYEAAFFLLVHLPYMQPFADCNKRVARVACNLPLLAAGITPISWLDVTHRKREYMDATVAIYEQNETILLKEMFIDCFMHSSDRFRLMQEQKHPDPVVAKYRSQVKASVRAHVLGGTGLVPADIAIEHIEEFQNYVQSQLNALAENEMVGVIYELSSHIVQAWQESVREALRASQYSTPGMSG
jgi:hypothetical protein